MTLSSTLAQLEIYQVPGCIDPSNLQYTELENILQHCNRIISFSLVMRIAMKCAASLLLKCTAPLQHLRLSASLGSKHRQSIIAHFPSLRSFCDSVDVRGIYSPDCEHYDSHSRTLNEHQLEVLRYRQTTIATVKCSTV